ncbi:MAG: M20/M25/M40 family metallo-hydrolase [Acidobacteria bacterium]|nr:M20/M25/M40 family metallo-hydrolase [Acidobacteriota bacterium]
MRKTTALLVALLLLGAPASRAQRPASSPTRSHVEFLASDRLEGREAGSPGERLAADYLTAQLARIGARPLPGRADMFMPFEFTAGSRDGGSTVTVTAGAAPARAFSAPRDVRALSFSDDTDLSGPVVFAGYGLVVPESQNVGYDSYAALDVKDKIVVVLRYFPEDADQKLRAVLARYSDLRYKAMAARQRGARALLVVTGPRSPNAGELVPMSFDTALAGSGIPAASVTGAVADALFAAGVGSQRDPTSQRSPDGPPSRTLRDVQQELDSGNPHVAGFDLPGITLALRTSVVRERHTGRNVLAYLPGSAPVATDRPWVVIGAHYDHLGHGDKGTSLASKEEAGGIHHGADDNASGAAAVLAVAETLARSTGPRRRHIAIAFWSAEEIGLIGSNAFVTNPPMPIDRLAAYLNFDMVGRMQDNRLIVQATGTSPIWARLLERANVAAGFDLAVQPDPYQPSDVASFNQAGVPSVMFFTGSHPDYHKPSDTADKINYDDLDRVASLAASLVGSVANLAEAPPFTKVDQPVSRGSMAGVRVTTGTIPDYATEVKGLLLSGVIGGGPAEQAGLMKGDVIVEIAGQTIANIYDYTYALELLRVNQPVTVVYTRGGQRRETQLTPGARR